MFNYTKQSSIYLSTDCQVLVMLKALLTIIEFTGKTPCPSMSFNPHRVTCWGQSGSQIGGSGNSFLHCGHGHGMGLITQKHMCKPEANLFTMADRLLLPAWEVSMGSCL